MNANNISMTDAQLQEIKNAIDELKLKITPHIVVLTEAEKISLPKMGDAHSPFVAKALEYALQNPSMVPNYINAVELTAEANVYESVRSIHQPLKQICDMLHNTMMLAGSDAYVGSLSFYASVKDAAKRGVPGAQSILDDLSKHFNTKSKLTQDKNQAK